jgi:glycine/betaine/sarcosine/D-proline reductase family selenoprotein B
MVKELEETVNVPVVHICTIVPISLTVGANRIVPAVAIPHPLGNPTLQSAEEKLDRYSRERDQNLDELMQILKGDGNEGKNKSWLSRLRGK